MSDKFEFRADRAKNRLYIRLNGFFRGSDVDPAIGRTPPLFYAAGDLDISVDAGLFVPPIFADGFESGGTGAWIVH